MVRKIHKSNRGHMLQVEPRRRSYFFLQTFTRRKTYCSSSCLWWCHYYRWWFGWERQLLKEKLFGEFEIEDISEFKYYFGIEVTYTWQDIFIFERKYVLDLLQETSKLWCMIKVNSSMIQRRDTSNCGTCVAISQGYSREMIPIQKGGSLTMVTYTELIIQVRWVIEGPPPPPQGLRFNSLWCQFGWANLASLKKKVHFRLLHILVREPCDLITTTYIAYGRQLVDMLTKGLLIERFNQLTCKIWTIDIYSPTWKSVVNIIFIICTYYTVLVNFWEELSTSQV